ncbi:MAG: DUF4159 domain-containing protein [Pirellulaceae bacterium]|nr:DUF4159 domain-containing protein [Pirellulaceae bacterium]
MFNRLLLVVITTLCLWHTDILEQRAYGQPVTAEAVERTIDRAIDFLRQSQQQNNSPNSGRWDGAESYGSAQTALVVLALLNCGLSPDEPTVAEGLSYIQSHAPTKTYETALQIMAYCAANPNRYARQIRNNVEWLEKAQVTSGKGKGGWGYEGKGGQTDPSNAQFAVLALWDAQRSNIVQSHDAMKLAAEYWNVRQKNGAGNFNRGAWSYNGSDFSGSMTCAGIASMIMAEDALQIADVDVTQQGIQCCVEEPRESLADLGVAWLQRNYTIDNNPGTGAWWFYYLYGLERVGRLTGKRFYGEHDWYREGCQLLVARQDRLRGFIPEGQGNTGEVTSTALALLFLSKGRRQVVIGRLSLDDATEHTLHRHAIHNLTGHIEDAWKRDLAWQHVPLQQSTLEQLLESPILHLSGSNAIQLSAAHKKLLKDYVEQGGFLFAEARNGDGCSGDAFDKSFRALMEELFQTPLLKLPPEHPVWFAETTADLSSMPKDFWLYGLETCCRTSVIYSPISLGCRWELLRPDGARNTRLPENIRKECEAATILGVNVATYATGRELKKKLDIPEVVRSTQAPNPILRGMLRLPRLMHSGGAEDTPRAIPNLMEVFKRERLSSQAVSDSPLIAIDPKFLEEAPIVYLSGRRRFQFSDAERQHLKAYFENGGMVLGDAVCGSGEFADAVREELRAVLKDANWVKMPSNHPMLTTEFEGFDVRRVTILNPGTQTGQAMQMQRYEGIPVIEMLMWKERVVAIFSPYDLSCALESRQSSQCRGYPRADAARIGINMLLYALLN